MKNVGNIIVEKNMTEWREEKKTKVTNNQAAFPVNCIAININNFCCFFSSFLYAYQFKNVFFSVFVEFDYLDGKTMEMHCRFQGDDSMNMETKMLW